MNRFFKAVSGVGCLLIAAIPSYSGEDKDIHPAFDLVDLRPSGFEPRVTGMEFMSGNRMAISTWQPNEVYILTDFNGPKNKISVRKVAVGFKEVMGLTVVHDTIFVADQDKVYALLDRDGDGLPETKSAIGDIPFTGTFHEWSFGLIYKDDKFFTALSVAATPTGKTLVPQKDPRRGDLVSLTRQGALEIVASGLRAPNGLCLGPEGDLFATDNQGSWLPASKLIRIAAGRNFGHVTEPPGAFEDKFPTPPVAWLPYGAVTKSPTQPAYMATGPYAGQFFYGDIAYGVVRRVCVEKIAGEYQGCVLKFSGGFEAAVNRLLAGPDGSLYLGGLGNGDQQNWGWHGKKFGLQRLRPNGNPVFEISSVHARQGGFEIIFSQPVDKAYCDAKNFNAKQWWYEPTSAYGGPQKDISMVPVQAASISKDGMRVFLEMEGLRRQQVVQVHMEQIRSKDGKNNYTPDFWYTLNALGAEAFRP